MPGKDPISQLGDLAALQANADKILGMVDSIVTSIKSVPEIAFNYKNASGGAELKKNTEELVRVNNELTQAQKQLNAEQEKAKTLEGDLAKRIAIQREQNKQKSADLRAEARDAAGLNDAYKKLELQYQAAARAAKNLAATPGTDPKKLQEANKAAKDLSDQLKAIDNAVGQNQRGVGNYSGALKVLEEEFKKVSAAMAQMEAKGANVQNFGARTIVQGFGANQHQNSGPTALAGGGLVPVSVLNEDAEAYAKLSQQAGYLNTIIQKNEVGFSSVTQQIRTNERALQSLRAAGLGGSEAFEKLREETIESAREMKEFQRQQKLLESELPALKALTLAAKGLGGAYAIGAGAVALFAEGNEKVEKELNKLIAIMTILQGLNEAWELVNQSGAAITAIRAAGTEALTVATAAYEFVVEGATAATVALNAALVASGIGAVLVALGGLIYLLSKAKVNTLELYEAQTKLNEAYKDYYEALVKANENLESELKKQDEVAKKQEEIFAINVRSVADQLKLAALKRANAEADKARADKELEDLKTKLGANEELQGQYDEQIRRIGRLKDLSADYNAQIAERASKGEGHDVLDDQLKNNEALVKVFQSQADAVKVKLDRFKEVTDQQEEAEQKLKLLNAEDQKFAHELYERKIKALHDITTIMREQSAEVLELQQLETVGSLSSRLTAANAEKAVREQIIQGNLNQELRAENLTGTEREAIRVKYQQEFYKLDEEFIGRVAHLRYDANEQEILDNNFTQAEILESRRKFFEKEEQDAQRALNNSKAAIETDRDQRLKALLEKNEKDDPLGEDLKKQQKYEEQKLSIEIEASNKILRADKEKNAKLIAQADQKEQELKRLSPGTAADKDKQLKDIQDLEAQKNALTAQSANIDLQIEQNNANLKKKIGQDALADKKRLAEAEIELGQNVANAVAAFVDGGFERQLNAIQHQIDINNKLKETETARLASSSLSAQQRAAEQILLDAKVNTQNEALQRKQRDIKIKEAQFDREKGILDVVVNTAKAVTDVLPDIPLSVIMGAIGAAQIAAILARPIPKFAAGTASSPEGWAWTDERGPELYRTPGGQVFAGSDKGPTLRYLQRGTEIIPNGMYADPEVEIIGYDRLKSFWTIDSSTSSTYENRRLEQKIDRLTHTMEQLSRDQIGAMKRYRTVIPPSKDPGPEFWAHIYNSCK